MEARRGAARRNARNEGNARRGRAGVGVGGAWEGGGARAMWRSLACGCVAARRAATRQKRSGKVKAARLEGCAAEGTYTVAWAPGLATRKRGRLV